MARHTCGDSAWSDRELEMLRQIAEHYVSKESEAMPVDDDYIERRRRYAARRYPRTYHKEREDHSSETHSDRTVMKNSLMLCVGVFGLVVSAGLIMMVMLG